MRHKVARALAILAIAWSLVLIGGAFVFPFYHGVHVTVPCPGCPEVVTTGTQTLVENNGRQVLRVVSIPLVASLLAAPLVWRRGSHQGAGTAVALWLLVSAMTAFTILGMLTIGIFVLPVTLLLTAAALLSRSPRPA